MRALSDAEQDALAALGPDVADGSITEDEAMQLILRARPRHNYYISYFWGEPFAFYWSTASVEG